jgi:hypothetical protein
MSNADWCYDRAMRSVAFVLLLAGAPAFAEEAGEGHAEEHHHHENHVAIFAGATTGLGDNSTTHFTLGADYERRLNFVTHALGIGVLVDSAFGDDVETLVAGFVSLHPVTGLMVYGGAGAAFLGAGHDATFTLRGGAAYFFELGKFSLGPAASIDHVSGENAIVYGLSGGTGF